MNKWRKDQGRRKEENEEKMKGKEEGMEKGREGGMESPNYILTRGGDWGPRRPQGSPGLHSLTEPHWSAGRVPTAHLSQLLCLAEDAKTFDFAHMFLGSMQYTDFCLSFT